MKSLLSPHISLGLAVFNVMLGVFHLKHGHKNLGILSVSIGLTLIIVRLIELIYKFYYKGITPTSLF